MSDTQQDVEINKREQQIKNSREAFACTAFEAVSKAIPLCWNCGWDEQAHIDATHEKDGE